MTLLRRAGALTENWGWLGFAYAAFAFYLLSPLTIVVIMSLKDGPFMGFPIDHWTLKWYGESVRDSGFIDALMLSIAVALTSTAIAMVIGIWVAVAMTSGRMIASPLFFALVCLPIVVPSIVQAIALRIFIQTIGIDPGPMAIILAHAIHSVPFIALMVLTRLGSMPKHLTEAARDLGADRFIAFVRVTVPYLMPALAGGAIFGLLLSFDDFVRATFLGSYAPTLPVLIYQRIYSGLSPEIAAISSVVLLITVLLGLFAETILRTFKLR